MLRMVPMSGWSAGCNDRNGTAEGTEVGADVGLALARSRTGQRGRYRTGHLTGGVVMLLLALGELVELQWAMSMAPASETQIVTRT